MAPYNSAANPNNRRIFIANPQRAESANDDQATSYSKKTPVAKTKNGKVDAERRKLLLYWIANEPDLTLAQLRLRLDQQAGVAVSQVAIWRWLKRLGLRLKKKSLHAQERDTE